jgi:hypothetical protein
MEQIDTSLMSVIMTILFYSLPAILLSTPKAPVQAGYTKAGLLMLNNCLLKTYYVPSTIPDTWKQ